MSRWGALAAVFGAVVAQKIGTFTNGVIAGASLLPRNASKTPI